MFIERLRTAFDLWLGAPASWFLTVVSLYIFLESNVDFAPSLTWHDGQRIAQLVLMAGVAVLILAVPAARNAVADTWVALPRWSRVALFAAFGLGIVSAMRAPLWRWALLEWAMLVLLVAVTLGVAAGRRVGGVHLDRLLVMVVFATATAYAAKTVVIYLAMLTVGAEYGQGFNVRELFTGFSNIRFFGHIQTMLLPFLLLPAMWWATTPRQRVLLGAGPALWWMLVVASGTRGTWLGLSVGILTATLFGGRHGRRWIKWQLAGAACGLLCYVAFVQIVPNLLEQPVSFLHRAADITSLSMREVLWDMAIRFSRENPLLGVGPMHFAYYATAVAAHPHNAILQFTAEWGIPAALSFTAVFAAGGLAFAARVRRVAAGSDTQVGLTAVALLAALTGAAAQAMVDGILVMPVSQIVLALICGWAIGYYFSDQSSIARCGILEKALCAAIAMCAVGGAVYGVLPEIDRLEQREAAFLATHPPDTVLLPRFWAQGWIKP